MSEAYDALVVGGGPAGAATAICLARAGASVLVVERRRFPRRKVCGEYVSGTSLPLLDRLGVGTAFRAQAGPDVTRVGLFARSLSLEASLPRPPAGWGRALSRERLDVLMLDTAEAAGAHVRRAASVTSISPGLDGFSCAIASSAAAEKDEVRTRLVVAAHGSWEPGTLPTHQARAAARGTDLLAFKAHFRDAHLAEGLMPLLAFRGGYGGMVQCDDGRVSLSCCVRRDELTRMRAARPGDAGSAVLAAIRAQCLGVEEALGGATREGTWLATGPIRPGVRLGSSEPPGILRVGNAAGEAHPVVAEGISMALQGGGLLAQRILAWREGGSHTSRLEALSRSYARAWRQFFRPRVVASSVLARWAMGRAPLRASLPVVRAFPALLTLGARWSGKVSLLPE